MMVVVARRSKFGVGKPTLAARSSMWISTSMNRVRQKSSSVSMRPPRAPIRRSGGLVGETVPDLGGDPAALGEHLRRAGGRLGGRHLLDPIVDGRIDRGLEVGGRGQEFIVRLRRRVGPIQVGQNGPGGPDQMGAQRTDGHALEQAGPIPRLPHLVGADEFRRGLHRIGHQGANGTRSRCLIVHGPTLTPPADRRPAFGEVGRVP